MFDINKILVPTDLSNGNSNAYNHARQIAGRYGAQIDFIHIIPMMRYFSESLEQLNIPLDKENDVYPHAQERASAKIKELMDRYLAPESKGRAVVKISHNPSGVITEYAETGKYDLIVMDKKKYNADLLGGNIAKKVIRQSNIPVLHTNKTDSDEVKNILVPTDGAQASLKTLPMAVRIAQNHNAEITFLYVLEMSGNEARNVINNLYKSENKNIRDTLYDGLDRYFSNIWTEAKLYRGDGSASQIVVGEGASNATINIKTVIKKAISAHTVIADYAEEYVDLTIMAKQEYSGLSQIFFGSTTEKVDKHLKSPTVSVEPTLDKKKVSA